MTLSKNYNGKLNESSVYQAFDVHSLLNQNVRRRKPDAIKCAQYLSGEYEFVLVAKVVGYHSSISHAILDECCREWIVDAHIQDLLCQYLNSVSRVYSGEEKDESMIRQGLPRGSLLAEFLIDLYLVSIDKVAKASNCGYIRHGADICLFTSSHFQLSRMVQRLYGVLEMIGLSIDQNRLCLGKTRPDFKFLGRDIVQSSLPII